MTSTHTPWGRAVHRWRIDLNLDFLCEIPLEVAEAAVPSGLQPVPVRPGVGLMAVGLLSFVPGNLGYLPRLAELSCSVVVHPDLSADVTPDFGMSVFKVASDSPQFLRWARHKDKMPVHRGRDLRFELDRAQLGGRVVDADGPICEMHNVHPTPRFEPRTLRIQVFTAVDGIRWMLRAGWAGDLFEHQQSGGTVRVFDHPFFAPLGLGEQALPCHTQMMTPPRCKAVMSFEEPVRLS